MENSQGTSEPSASDASATVDAAPETGNRRDLSHEAAGWRVKYREAEARATTAENRLQTIRDAELAAAVDRRRPADGARGEIVSRLDATGLYDAAGELNRDALGKQLDAIRDQSAYLFDATHDRDVADAWRDVADRHPVVDESARRFCTTTEPDEIRKWGDEFAAWIAEHVGHVANFTERRLMNGVGSNAASHDVPVRGVSNPLRDAIMRRH